MTHDEWLASIDPQPMLAFLRDGGKISKRKATLFAVACCRGVWHLMLDERSRKAVAWAEQSADGVGSWDHTVVALQAASEASSEMRSRPRPAANGERRLPRGATTGASAAAVATLMGDGLVVSEKAARAAAYLEGLEVWQATYDSERLAHAAILRDIVGDPFAPAPTVAPTVLTWNAGMVPELAKSIYEKGIFQDLPVLADALEEAGSTDIAMLEHFRGRGPHARGCAWLDAMLVHKEHHAGGT
jgi:hypothetical protein